jgi:hypothetical protein
LAAGPEGLEMLPVGRWCSFGAVPEIIGVLAEEQGGFTVRCQGDAVQRVRDPPGGGRLLAPAAIW